MSFGWRNDPLHFKKYGGPSPSISYNWGRLPPRIKDLIVHYLCLFRMIPNYHTHTIPEDYEERDLYNLVFMPSPPWFVVPF